MDLATLKRMLVSFADRPDDVVIERGQITAQVREDLIGATLITGDDQQLIVREDDRDWDAAKWVRDRLARLDLLASRILEHIRDDPLLIPISGSITRSLEESRGEPPAPVDDVLEEGLAFLGAQAPGFTSVTYLTADAGEGKTSLIEAMARRKAHEYSARRGGWLLLPIQLGGRPFIRLDDLIVGALSNRFRFPWLYYEAVLELVRAGMIVLALDGFEEMFVETASGEAASSLGNLVRRLDSDGRLLVATRTAYFAHKGLEAQSKLMRSLDKVNVSFTEIALNRWDRSDFLKLSARAGIGDGDFLYDRLSGGVLGGDHPLLTRAVLARRLIEEYRDASDGSALVARLTQGVGESVFAEFVRALLEREANEKWIDRSQDPVRPLLTVEQHEVLLEHVAEEMWRDSVGSLPPDVLSVLVEIVLGETLGLPRSVVEQATHRISDHAFLRKEGQAPVRLAFDHDDFRCFFLGRYIGRLLGPDAELTDLRPALQVASLSHLAARIAVMFAEDLHADPVTAVERLSMIAQQEARSSYTRENCGLIVMALLAGKNDSRGSPVVAKGLVFPVDALKNAILRDVIFEKCVFMRSGTQNSMLRGVQFVGCILHALDFAGSEPVFDDASFDEESVPAVVEVESNDDEVDSYFDPRRRRWVLERFGASCQVDAEQGEEIGEPEDATPVVEDVKLRLAEKAVRQFRRATALSESVLTLKMGTQQSQFFSDVLPALESAGVLLSVAYQGSGVQRRFRMGIGLDEFEAARARSGGSFDEFLRLLAKN